MRVLIVDDEDLSLKRLNRILTESGEVEVCGAFHDPEAAQAYARTHRFDAAFLDITMPRISGMTLIGELRKFHPALPIVLVTGYEEYAVQAFDHEVIDYVIKPVTAERLNRSISRLKQKLAESPTPAREPELEQQPSAEAVPEVAIPRLTVSLFGGFSVRGGSGTDGPLKLRTPKTEELLAFLLCNRSTTRDALTDTLWKELSPQKASTNLNSTLYYVRRAIGDGGDTPIILKDRSGIRVNREVVDCDLYEFEELFRQMRRTPEHRHDPERFERMDALYAGELLKGRHYEWALTRARQLEIDFIAVLDTASRYHAKMQQPLRALYYFERILQLDPIREDVHREIILLYLALGRKSDAKRQYLTLETVLDEELGARPSAELERLMREQ
ncbi:response regulator [Saccharibacillus sacchari]|uniref:Response regulator n=1 Tax=Saccharibacillus sacchari TaxID=456493 RepID=A0ACC6P9C3_9BACL